MLTVRSGSEETNLAVSALSLMNEVRAKESAGDDRLEDDDWLLISSTEYVDIILITCVSMSVLVHFAYIR